VKQVRSVRHYRQQQQQQLKQSKDSLLLLLQIATEAYTDFYLSHSACILTALSIHQVNVYGSDDMGSECDFTFTR
jgi:hypothetical protein